MAAAGETKRYSSTVAVAYIFNLIVGAGALTIPHAFAQVGVVLGVGFLVLLAMLGFVSATFVVEGMACSNALLAERESDSLQLETVKFDEHSISGPNLNNSW